MPATLDLKDSVAADYVKGLYYTLYLNVLNEKGDWAFWLTRILPMHTGHITKLSKFGDGCVKFINHLIDKYAFYKVEVKSLNDNADFSEYAKYYCSDPSMYTMIFGEKLTSVDREKLLETILYLELIRRGYAVYMGKGEGFDIQFVAEKDGKRTYYQVTESINKQYKYDAFIDAYQKLNDGCEKVILTLDKGIKQTLDVRIKNLIDFLLEK